MRFLKAVDIDESALGELWEKVSRSGGYYSIGDGSSEGHFREVFFASEKVLVGPSLVVRIELRDGFVEVHPIVFGPEPFRIAADAFDDVIETRDRCFAGRPICCIIPDGMRGARRLARLAGMKEAGKTERSLSGVTVSCTVFARR